MILSFFSRHLLALLASVLCLTACRSVFVGRAGDAYRDGRYLEVAEVLAARENEFEALSRRERARYAMYRGLALIQLRDMAGARKWLEVCLGIDQKGKPSLTPVQRRRVEATLRTLTPLR